MTKQEQTIFFELLQAALWEREVELQVFQGDWSWERLLQAFHNHAILGVVAHTILSLPDSYLPNQKQSTFVIEYCANLFQTHQHHKSIIIDIFKKLELSGCNPILLKGEGLASLYPKTCIRSCGDIDIFVGPQKFQTAKRVINGFSTPEEISAAEKMEAEHHYHIHSNGIVFEIHKYPGIAADLSYRRVYQEISTQLLLTNQSSILLSTTISSNQFAIQVPSVEYNGWYLFNHLAQHFRDDGVGIRQFCDWLIVLKNNCSFSNNNEFNLEQLLLQIGMKRAWTILGGILVFQLGLPASDFPLFDKNKANMSQGFILSEIVNGRNFGFKSSNSDYKNIPHGFRRLLLSLKNLYCSSRPLYIISPSYPFRNFFYRLRFGLNGLLLRNLHFSIIKKQL